MKVTIEINCSPEEAREFLGLPDLKPMQAAVMARIEGQVAEAADRFSPDAMLKSWMSLMPQTPDQMKDLVGRFFRQPSVGGSGSGGPGTGGSGKAGD